MINVRHTAEVTPRCEIHREIASTRRVIVGGTMMLRLPHGSQRLIPRLTRPIVSTFRHMVVSSRRKHVGTLNTHVRLIVAENDGATGPRLTTGRCARPPILRPPVGDRRRLRTHARLVVRNRIETAGFVSIVKTRRVDTGALVIFADAAEARLVRVRASGTAESSPRHTVTSSSHLVPQSIRSKRVLPAKSTGPRKDAKGGEGDSSPNGTQVITIRIHLLPCQGISPTSNTLRNGICRNNLVITHTIVS